MTTDESKISHRRLEMNHRQLQMSHRLLDATQTTEAYFQSLTIVKKTLNITKNLHG